MSSWRLSLGGGAAVAGLAMGWALCGGLASAAAAKQPDFGPHVLVFSPAMPAAEMQAQIDKVYAIEEHAEFGASATRFLFAGRVPRGCAGGVLYGGDRAGRDAGQRTHSGQRACGCEFAAQQCDVHVLERDRRH